MGFLAFLLKNNKKQPFLAKEERWSNLLQGWEWKPLLRFVLAFAPGVRLFPRLPLADFDCFGYFCCLYDSSCLHLVGWVARIGCFRHFRYPVVRNRLERY